MTREHRAFQNKCDYSLGLIRASTMVAHDEITDAHWMAFTDYAQEGIEFLKKVGFREAEAQELVTVFMWGMLVRGAFVDDEKYQMMDDAFAKIRNGLEKIKEQLSEG